MNKWERVASVTKGGKPYFWFLKTLHYYVWVVYDRREKLWKVKIQEQRSGEEVYQHFTTAEQGKREAIKVLHKGLVFVRGGAY